MSLSPRRTLAVGLAATMSGVAIYFLGAGLAEWLSMRASTGISFSTMARGMTDVMESAERSHRIAMMANYIAGPLVIFGIPLATIGAVRWLWGGVDVPKAHPSA